MLKTIKRWAFWPLLALGCMTAGSMAIDPRNGSIRGVLIGLLVSAPLAWWINRRRGAA